MTLAEALDRLGVTYPDGADDETMYGILEEAWNAEPVDEEVEEEIVDEEVEAEEPPLDNEDEEVVEDEEEIPVVPASQARITASAVNALCSARDSELSALVSTGHMTPAQKKEIAKKFATKTAMAFALSHGDEISDGYDAVVASFKMNTPRRLGEKTAAQHVEGEKSPLVINAEKRANRSKGK
jgi:hypothetical protein